MNTPDTMTGAAQETRDIFVLMTLAGLAALIILGC